MHTLAPEQILAPSGSPAEYMSHVRSNLSRAVHAPPYGSRWPEAVKLDPQDERPNARIEDTIEAPAMNAAAVAATSE